MGYRVFLDSFSGDLAELKRGKRTPENALAVLNKSPMVSTWDMSENKWLCRLISDLKHEGLIVEQEQPYPWHRYKLTDAGKARLPSNVNWMASAPAKLAWRRVRRCARRANVVDWQS